MKHGLVHDHLVIAVAFIGPWRDPVRNIWVIEFGLIACVMVLPLALIAGPLRGIPLAWRLLDDVDDVHRAILGGVGAACADRGRLEMAVAGGFADRATRRHADRAGGHPRDAAAKGQRTGREQRTHN